MSRDPELTRRQFVHSVAVAALSLPAAMATGLESKPSQTHNRGRGIYVSVRDEILMAGNFASVAEGLAFCGLNGLEIAVNRDYTVRAIVPTTDRPRLKLDNPDDVKRLAAQIAENNIRVSAFLLPNNFNAPDIDSELTWVTKVIQVAGELKIPAARIDAIMQGADSFTQEQRSAIFAKGVKYVLDHTKGVPVDLGIENHGVQGNNADFLEGQIKMVGSRRLGITMDVGNFYWAGYPLDTVYDILKQLAPYAKHTHVKNINYPEDIRNKRREPGYEYGKYMCPIPEGNIDVRKVVSFLKAAGYKRDLCIEDESLGKFDEATRRANLKAAADYLKALV